MTAGRAFLQALVFHNTFESIDFFCFIVSKNRQKRAELAWNPIPPGSGQDPSAVDAAGVISGPDTGRRQHQAGVSGGPTLGTPCHPCGDCRSVEGAHLIQPGSQKSAAVSAVADFYLVSFASCAACISRSVRIGMHQSNAVSNSLRNWPRFSFVHPASASGRLAIMPTKAGGSSGVLRDCIPATLVHPVLSL